MDRSYDIRAVTPADMPLVSAMFREHLVALGYTPDPELDQDMVDVTRTYAGSRDLFVIARDSFGDACAMGGVRDGEIRRLFVRLKHRKQKLARRLVLTLLQHSRAMGQDRWSAVVARDNAPALACFRALGFVVRPTPLLDPRLRHCDVLELSP